MSTPAVSCTEPGCAGHILDGYCDVCGSPAAPGAGQGGGTSAAAAPASGASASGASASGASASGPSASGASAPGASEPGAGGAGPDQAGPDPEEEEPITPPARPQPQVLSPVPNGTPCEQPGCAGHILDGYCDVCGSSAQSEASAGASPLASAPSSASRASNRLSATALGSARARQAGTASTRRVSSTSSQRMRTARLGAGLTTIPPMPAIDAAEAVMTNPVVPEGKRFCSNCGTAVGRSQDGRPGRTTGFCAKCRQPFSFDPKLRPGDLVAGQYEVAGCLAHGGLGWIYLARDRNVSNRWVVLKGLLNTGDPDALAAAIAEQRFLAQVEHPAIVEIYNFVTHEDAGYIVMEYVGGTSLKALLKQRMRKSGHYDPLPPDQALAYIVEILPAFQYLHDLGLAYCDFKPDNVIQVGDDVKLIDLGGVRRIDDQDSAIFGTLGYQAPEVARLGVSVASDIYTIGRTLTVLMMEFRGYQTTYLESLPPVEDVPLFQQHDSLYRLLLKACAKSPDDRFASADEMRVQLLGVLREVVASQRRSGRAISSSASLLFEEPSISTDTLDWYTLPALRPDPHDPQMGFLAGLTGLRPNERLSALREVRHKSPEALLSLARVGLEVADPGIVYDATATLLRQDPWEWRAVWMQGLQALAQRDAAAAQSAFNAVYGQVPGELAPKFALAFACEVSGESDIAESLYAACARTDANYTPAGAFGMARIRQARGDVAGAVEALDLVAPTSRAYALARQKRAYLLARAGDGLGTLAEALGSIAQVPMEPRDRAELRVEVFESAFTHVTGQGGPDERLRIEGYPASDEGVRLGLEAALRELARLTPDRGPRTALVDRANEVRPWTLT